MVTATEKSQLVNSEPCEAGQSLGLCETVESTPSDVPAVATPGGGQTKMPVCNATMLSEVTRPTMAYRPIVNECES